MTTTTDVLAEIADERARQVDVHGWDEEHDDRHGRQAWAWLLNQRTVELSCPFDAAVPDARRQLLEVAAIAVAAIESLDRQALLEE